MSDESRRSPLWPADNPAVIAHVAMLQGIIARLANNSAASKTWCLALLGALFAFAGAAHLPALVNFAPVPIVAFGYLDAMYLAQERAYRKLFAAVRQSIREGRYGIEQSYEAAAPLEPGALPAALRSWSVYPVYLGLLVVWALAASLGWLAPIAGRQSG